MVSKPIENIDSLVQEVAQEMLWIMRGGQPIPCLGLAAIQLGEPIRMIALMQNMYSRDFREPVIIINPEIVKKLNKMVRSREGCLSIGDGNSIFTVQRYKQVKVKGMDLEGNPKSYKEHGIPAFALQHEIDHLNGKLISDTQ